jgi:hypothetical protein
MTSGKSNVKFYLNILEVSGKDITNTYVNDIRRHLDDRNLNYNFDIVTNEEFYDTNKHTMYGGKSTFPYRHFEKTFDNIRNTLQFSSKPSIETHPTPIEINTYTPDESVDTPDESVDIHDESVDTPDESVDIHDEYVDIHDEYVEEKVPRTNSIVDRLVKYNPLELNGTKTKHSIEITKPESIILNVPSDYSGVIHILLTIDVKNTENIIEGGITQLNQFLESYPINKKEN